MANVGVFGGLDRVWLGIVNDVDFTGLQCRIPGGGFWNHSPGDAIEVCLISLAVRFHWKYVVVIAHQVDLLFAFPGVEHEWAGTDWVGTVFLDITG